MSEKEEMQEIRDIVDEAKNPKTFNIIKVLEERAYPQEVVEVILDENTSYQASLIKEKLDKLDEKIAKKNPTAEQREYQEKLLKDLEELNNKIAESQYVFHIRGISEGKRERLLKDAIKKYPIEYEKSVELSALLGQNAEAKEKKSPERDQLFTDLLWKEQIEKVVAPDGEEQSGLTYNEIRALRDNLPLSASARINTAIEKIRTATAVFMMETGEDFLAKP